MQPHRLPLRPQPHCSFAPSCAVSPFLAHLPPSALLDSSDSSSLTYAALASVALMASSHLALSALACSPSFPQQLRPSYPLAQPVQHHPPLVWPQQHAALVSPSRMLPARVHTRELHHQFRECFRSSSTSALGEASPLLRIRLPKCYNDCDHSLKSAQ